MRYLGNFFLVFIFFLLLFTGCSDESTQSVKELNKKAQKLLQANDPSAAIKAGKKSLRMAKQEYGAGHPSTVTSLLILAMAYQADNDFAQARNMYKEALEMIRETKGENSLEAAQVMNNLAGLYYNQKKYEKAASVYQQCLKIAELHYSSDDRRIEKIRNNFKACQARASGSKNGTESGKPSASGGQKFDKDLVPQKVKAAAIRDLKRRNIELSEQLKPLKPVKIDGKGVVFPYRAFKKSSVDSQGETEVVLLFGAIKNQDQKGAYVFKKCRVVSYSSYTELLARRDPSALQAALIQIFPGLYPS